MNKRDNIKPPLLRLFQGKVNTTGSVRSMLFLEVAFSF
ncbi:hypothetical protein CP04DC42_0263 [Chlamydia psittaci 04DC42]|nr:hypothetical protein CP04DC42_0263 [Chlamydia psittaci 04DC42]EPP31143.1 hypothetical protein CPC197_1082 [Chlamydia psittaci C1/97]